MTITHQFQLTTLNPSEIIWANWLDVYLSTRRHTDHSIYERYGIWYLCTKKHGEQPIPVNHYITLDDTGQLDLSSESSLDVLKTEDRAIRKTLDQSKESIPNLIKPTPKAEQAITDLDIDTDQTEPVPKPKRKPRRRKSVKKD